MVDNLDNEIWKDIIGYEGLYQVSNLGRVKKVKAIYGKLDKLVKNHKNKDGYIVVALYKNSCKNKKYRVHRLVAEAFIPNPNNYPIVNHKDENPSNPRVDNLEWCTIKYNNTYGNAISKRIAHINYKKTVANTDYKKRTQNTNYKTKKLYQYDENLHLVRIWSSIKEALEHGYKYNGIYACCTNKQKKHKNYIWSYVEK
ncbi:NUMOD4 domain-containing protein [Clostridium sp. CTA-5]